MERPERIHPRLKEYDYSQNGCYFVTICVANRAALLGRVVGQSSVGRHDPMPPQAAAVELSRAGCIVDGCIQAIETHYEGVFVDRYVIMPDHIHLLLRFDHVPGGGMRSSRPTLSMVVRGLKRAITHSLGRSIWQTSFYEHVVRCQEDYAQIWQYIENNPIKWLQSVDKASQSSRPQTRIKSN